MVMDLLATGQRSSCSDQPPSSPSCLDHKPPILVVKYQLALEPMLAKEVDEVDTRVR